jgi:hypothetical protein
VDLTPSANTEIITSSIYNQIVILGFGISKMGIAYGWGKAKSIK